MDPTNTTLHTAILLLSTQLLNFRREVMEGLQLIRQEIVSNIGRVENKLRQESSDSKRELEALFMQRLQEVSDKFKGKYQYLSGG